MNLNLMYVHGDSIGYGRLGVSLAKALGEMGVDIYDHLPDPTGYYENKGYRSGVCPVVCWVSTPTHARGWWEGQTPVIFTMWEATQLPESFRENLHEFETCIVPSEHNLELFSQYHDNVRCVYLGIDPQVWHYTPRTGPGASFNFLIGGSGPRKGTDLAYKAFMKVFRTWPKDGPVPKLIMKNTRGENFYGDRVEVIGGRIPVDEEVALYASAHCYLQPSRGEGFGLQPLQALAQGIPTILTDAHGHRAFSRLGIGLSTELVRSGYFIYGDAGSWWQPNFDELCAAMEFVYRNYDQALDAARHAADHVAREFTWQRTAEGFVAAVGEDLLAAPPLAGPTGRWIEPVSRRYLTITNRDWACDIAGVSYQFRRGQEYHELADVKRILFEAGLLANECLGGDDVGLAPHQLERLGAYTASHAFCQLCGQKLGTGTKREDVLA